MLSRTADSLYWLGRYIERAGNNARGLQVALRMASLTRDVAQRDSAWRALLIASGCEPGFRETGQVATQETVVRYLAADPSNPSSIISCIEAARRNGRQVRTALTVDMWEAVNETWSEARRSTQQTFAPDNLPVFLDWVKSRTVLFNGAYADTMLRDEAWRFVRLGTMLERADNTARVLDVHHHALGGTEEDGAVGYLQWQAILRSVSALRAYHWVYHSRLEPRRIAELLILRPELPRSMVACYGRIEETLDGIAASHGGRKGECHRLAGEMHARLRFGRIADVMAGGLHDFLTATIDRNLELGRQIQGFYLQA
ncbi:alpha-E domain-containing protein [Roseomonas sp. JC162]|uniref:Alpha-E domain-containing protein n=1 Tax=Neoroseomonas marina TaxID=1232220 RepID=A0A848EDR8_9PROT|nr:alpha-E domain-containing protein [Neoroseomonas marina]NMJ41669.1 alpha-E domain-containing protein [Neoroseomonas marina]